MDDKCSLDDSSENHFSDDYEPFPIDFSEWTLLDDTCEDDDNYLEEGEAQTDSSSEDIPKSSSSVSNGKNASVDSMFVNEKDSYHDKKKTKECSNSNSQKEASVHTASKMFRRTSRLSSNKSKDDNDLNDKQCSSSQISPQSNVIKPSKDDVVQTASNSAAKEMKENISNNAEVENISKLHSKVVGNDKCAQKPAALALHSNKQSAMGKQNQCKNFGNNAKSLSKDSISYQGAKPDFKKKTVVGAELDTNRRMDHCGNTMCNVDIKQRSNFFEVQNSVKGKTRTLKRNKKRGKVKNKQLLKSKEPENPETWPPPKTMGSFTQILYHEAHTEESQTEYRSVSQHNMSLKVKETENVRTIDCSAGKQQTSCSVEKCNVRCVQQASETDAKTFVNKKFAQHGTKQLLKPESSPSEQYAPVGTRYEKDKKFSNHSSKLAKFDFPNPKTVSKEILNMALNFEVSNSFNSLSPLVNFNYGIRLGYLLSSDVDKASFRDTFIKNADSYNLFFASHDSGVLDLFFYKEVCLANMINHIRKARLGLRHLCLSIYKMSNEKDDNGEIPVKCLKESIQNRPKVDQYFTIHNVPEGIPLSFLSFIFPDAITIELDDVNLKFTKNGCNVRLGINHKKYPEHFNFKGLFYQVYINNVPVLMTSGLTKEKVIPEMKDKTDVQKKPDELKERIQNQKTNESRKILRTVAVARDINANEKKNRANEFKEEKIVTATETPKSTVLNAELPFPEDVIDLTGEASSPFANLDEDLSEISDSSFNSDDLEGPLDSSSEDERSSQSHGREKSSKAFDRLYDKYVLKKRRMERHEKIHDKASSDRDIAKTKGSKPCGVTRDMQPSVRTKRRAKTGKSKNLSAVNELSSTGKKEPSNYSTESHHRKSSEKNGKSSREDRFFSSHFNNRDKREHGNILERRSSNSPPPSKAELAVLEHRTGRKIFTSQEKRIAKSSRSPPSQRCSFSSSNSRQIIRQKSDSRGQSEEGDLRFTLDNMRTLHHGKKTKEGGGGATEDSTPAFRSLLGECLSRVNRKRPPSRSPSPSQRKVLFVKRSFSPTLQTEKGEGLDSSNAAVSERKGKMEKDEPQQKASQLSPGKVRDLHNMTVQASDNVMNERHQLESEKDVSQERFTVSKSLLVKLMRQIIEKDAQPDADHPLTSESNNRRTELETLDLDQDTDLSTSSLPKDKEIGNSDQEELQLKPQQSGKSLIDASTLEKMSETSTIPVAAQTKKSEKNNKSVIKTKDDIPEGTAEMSSKTDPQKKSRNSPSEKSTLLDKSSSDLPILPLPIPPPVFPSILASSSVPVPASAEKPCFQSETNTTTLSSDPPDTSFTEGGVWLAPPSVTTTNHHETLSTMPVPSASTPLPALSHISPAILQPPMMHPLTFIAPPPFHPHVIFPPHQLQVPQVQASVHNELIPLSGVWQAPPQGPF